MAHRLWTVLVCLTLTSTAIACRLDDPPIFSKVSFADAVAANKASDKLLVVKFTASWCGPCKQMDKTTWRNEDVVEWFNKHGTVIAVDVDQEQNIAVDNKISAMPTMVVFKGGAEVHRFVGYMSGKDLIEDIEAIRIGAPIPKRERISKDDPPEPRRGHPMSAMQKRSWDAQQLTAARKYEQATDEFVWLWLHMAEEEPDMDAVRTSFMASNMKDLAKVHANAKARFATLRDQTEQRLKGAKKSFDDLDDWIVLNEVVGEEAKTLEWFDRIKDQPDSRATIQHTWYNLSQLLERSERWADIGRLTPNPVAAVRGHFQMMNAFLALLGNQGPEEAIENAAQMCFDGVGKVYLGQLACGRDEAAQEVADLAIKLKDTPELRRALVQWALKGKQAREAQRDLVKDGKDLADIRERLEAALKAR